MTNNDIIRQLRYLFDYSDNKIIAIFKLVEYDINEKDLEAWFRKDDDPLLVEMNDKIFATFLNGLIIEKRGKKDGPLPKAEKRLNNNIILKKLKIALNLKSDEILGLFTAVGMRISKHEISAFFRNPEHKSFRLFGDQFLRNFLRALQKTNRTELGKNMKKAAEESLSKSKAISNKQ